MEKVVLLFPNTVSISNFLLQYRIAGLEVNSRERSVIGSLTSDQIMAACTQYNAYLKTPIAAE